MMSLTAGDGVKEQTAQSFSDALAAELRKVHPGPLLTQGELSAVLSVERQKQLLGCGTNECMAELAGALDVQQVVTGTLSKLGESWLLQVQRVDAAKGTTLAHASRRKKGGSIDDLLDELPSVAKELFAGGAAPASSSPVESAPVAKVESPPVALPPPYQDVPLEQAPEVAKLVFLSDGKGHLLAVEPFGGMDKPFFAGDEKALYQQRVFGGGSSGKESFDMVFWDPRAKAPWQASFEFRAGKYALQCGDKKIEFKPVPAAQQKKLVKTAKLNGVRWQRHGYALARDDEGNWFYVDQARTPEDSTDFRLYLGTQGKLAAYQADVLAHDEGGDIFKAAGGKLKVNTFKKEGEWLSSAGATKLTVLPVEDNARQIYTALGAYKGMPLGTACDAFF